MGQPNAPGRQYAAGAAEVSAEVATAGYNVQLDRLTHAIDSVAKAQAGTANATPEPWGPSAERRTWMST